MTGVESILSVIATIISSVALIAVAMSLVLQNRQLRANQIQAVREMHLEVMKMVFDNPTLASSIYQTPYHENFPLTVLLNLHMSFWETSYSLNVIDKFGLTSQVEWFFSSEDARAWWAGGAREAYENEASTKTKKEFFMIVDRVFRDAMNALQASGSPDVSLPDGQQEGRAR